MRKSLADMKPGQSGVLVEILSGRGMIGRLDAPGLRLCKQVRKVSSIGERDLNQEGVDRYAYIRIQMQ